MTRSLRSLLKRAPAAPPCGWFGRNPLRGLALAAALVFPVNAGFTQFLPAAPVPQALAWSYADTADVFATAPLVLRAKIVAATALKGASATPGTTRFFIEADAVALIRGAGGVAPRVRYLVDVAPDSRGRMPKLKKLDVLLAAQPVAGRAGEIQLVAPDAQQRWTAPLDARVRSIVTAAVDPAAPPEVTGVASAFHVAGTVIGEGETQIFVATAGGAPVSLSILRRPGESPRWALALGEIVDESAAVPQRDTLAWYRLACFLPADLPVAAARELSTTDADIAREDYALVMRDLGACPRARPAARPTGA
jgi:hypothetical protein